MKKRLLPILLAVVMCLAMAAPALAAESDFTIEDGVLTKYNGSGGAVTIPNSVTSIGERAFYYCTGLTGVTIPNSVTEIGDYAFYGCTGLTGVTIPGSVTGIGSHAFSGCTGLTSVTIPNSVTSIGEWAFSGCTGLTGVTIPDGVTSIGAFAFIGCTGLTGVTIPDSVTSIGDRAFIGCTGLTAIQVSAGNQTYASVDGVLFTKDMKTLHTYPGGKQGSYTIPDSVTCIGDCTFSGCKSLTGVTLPNSVTSIGEGAFLGCTSLTGVTIPDSVTSIGDGAFNSCTGLTSVTIPGSVTGIGDGTFSYCTGLTSVTIPGGVTSIGERAFDGCGSLKDVYYAGTEAQWKNIKIDHTAVIGTSGNAALESATVHYNSTAADQPQQPTLPTVQDIPPTGTAVPTPQTVKLDGKDVQFQTYALKDEKGYLTNYVKIRDLANVLNGTKAQFNVSWDGKISIISNTAYQAVGGEGATPYSGSQTYKSVSDTPVSFNGSDVKLTSFSITYQSGGYTYYKLRDLGQLLNFEVRYDGGVIIETDKPYTGK